MRLVDKDSRSKRSNRSHVTESDVDVPVLYHCLCRSTTKPKGDRTVRNDPRRVNKLETAAASVMASSHEPATLHQPADAGNTRPHKRKRMRSNEQVSYFKGIRFRKRA